MEGAFRTIECRLAQMNVFSHCCLTFSANDFLFSPNEQQKVYFHLSKFLIHVPVITNDDDDDYDSTKCCRIYF